MVVAALVANPAWRALPPAEREPLFAAALLHDVGKPARTPVAPDGTISSRGHALTGARFARGSLYRGDWPGGVPPLAVRETIAALVRHHGLPLDFLDRPDPEFALIRASQSVRLDRLALLAEADARGRVCSDQAQLLERIALFREFGIELACADGPRRFPSDHTRFRYLAGGRGHPDDELYDDTRCEVVVMSGLPGAGKTTWRRTRLPDWPVVSLDHLRAELAIRPEQEQGPVIARARALARDHLRAGRSFAWDATNVTRRLRDGLIAFLTAGGARIRLVYVETDYAELLARNRRRADPIPTAKLERLIDRLEPPDLTEAHRVEWVAG